MCRRILLGLTFLAAFTTIGVGIPNSAEAWRRGGWGRPYVGHYYGSPRSYYYNYVPYRTYYGPPVYRPYYGSYYYGGPGYYYYGPRARVTVGF